MCHNPDYDLESFEKHIDECLQREICSPTPDDALKFVPLFHDLLTVSSLSAAELNKMLAKHRLIKYRKNSFLIQSLYLLNENGVIDEQMVDHIVNLLKIKRCKSHSGILSITVFTSPYPSYTDKEGRVQQQQFTCNWNCHYCPNEPGQPRSYLKGEPGVLRANRYGFDACKQVWGRLGSLHNIGHKTKGAKLEILILGGTFTSYPVEYRDEFIRDVYYAANTFHDKEKRERLNLSEEIRMNRDGECRVIGLTVEFRPDCITAHELRRLRLYGCTRVQLGVQHIDNNILKAINRKCTTERYINGLKLLKDVGYKVDIHIMANLPFSSPEIDRRMLLNDFLGVKAKTITQLDDGTIFQEYDISRPDLSADQWKLYPCETVPYTEIERWYREGTYQPYAKNELYKILYDTKRAMYPWIRTNRIIRDIPKGYIIASSDDPNTGQIIIDDLKRNGHTCMCIRCREVKERTWDAEYILVVRKYNASCGIEYFISAESNDMQTLYGFVRLRLRDPTECGQADAIFPELSGCALIRELHVYGNMQCVMDHDDASNTSQHKGVGKRLLQYAELIAHKNNYERVAVISGVGVQRYYERQGYALDTSGNGQYMIKKIHQNQK